jgi:hypothetical protein
MSGAGADRNLLLGIVALQTLVGRSFTMFRRRN